MKPRIALATYDRAPSLAPDDQLLLPELDAIGIAAEAVVWSSDEAIWETFDGIVIRSCWDYHRRANEFHEWLERLDASRLPVWNSVPLVQWNSNKKYLADLASRGVPTIPTHIVAKDDLAGVDAILGETDWKRFVVKPTVSASGFETHALPAPLTNATRAIVERVLSFGDALVQPFVEQVPRDGELSLMFIDGEFSHAAIKQAKPGEFRVQVEHGGSVEPTTAAPAMIQHARAVLDALPEIPLYARVDGVQRRDEFLLMELELIEPNLFFDGAPGSAARFARALDDRLRNA